MISEAMQIAWDFITRANSHEALELRAARKGGRAQYWRQRARTFRMESCKYEGRKRTRLLRKAETRERWAKLAQDRAEALKVRAKLTKELQS